MALDAQRWRTSDMPVALNSPAPPRDRRVVATLRVPRELVCGTGSARSGGARNGDDTGPYAVVRHPMYASALYRRMPPARLGYGVLSSR
jgi:hypothetical protein